MIISESAIHLAAEHYAFEKHEKRESLAVWHTGGNGSNVAFSGRDEKSVNVASAIAQQQAAAKLTLSHAAQSRPRYVKGIAGEIGKEEKGSADLKMRILQALIERLTGKKININDPGKVLEEKMKEVSESESDPLVVEQKGVAPTQSAGYGLVYEYHESYHEVEKTRFSAEGIINTVDGREISFATNLSMSREFISETNVTIRAGDALKDPLILNFNGTAAELSDTTFDFDIDADGTEDHLKFVGPGSGFLVLDRNGDGAVTDGSELFGALTGDGFNELRAFDDDDNDWIDENDAVYDNLRIWEVDGSGERTLLSIGQKGVGAIYLGHVTTPFSLKDNDNNLQAEIRSTGLFLNEDGSTGTLQQLDLVV